MSILDRIDNTIAGGLCPCGATPRPGSPYCGPDCEPTHISRDTDTRQSGHYATPMRWRPDLVTAADDTDLIPIGSERIGYTGPHRSQIFERASDHTAWHLRLDDGHRFVGCDLTDMGARQDPITVEQVARIHDTWQRLERELGNTRHLEPDELRSGGVVGYPTRWQHLPGHAVLRHCKRCNQHVATRPGRRPVTDSRPAAYLATTADIRERDTNLEPCQLCANCRNPFPGPPIYVTLERDHWTHTIRIRLKAAGYGPVQAELPLLDGGLTSIAERIQQEADLLETRLFETLATRPAPSTDEDPTRGHTGYRWVVPPELEDAVRRLALPFAGHPDPVVRLRDITTA